MSIVEKALRKLQAAGTTAPAAPPSAVIGTPVAARAATPEVGVRPPQRRTSLGSPQKTVTIDFDRLRQAGLLPPEHQQRELAHQYRTLKRPLIKHAFEPQEGAAAPGTGALRSIMVSSALPGDGKTFTSVNLALSLALEKDYSVLLVDGDSAKPHLSRTFGIDREPGLLDLLEDPSLDVESVIAPTSVRGLSLLPVGRRTENATELLASARMRQVVAKLESLDPHLLVLVDSAPILLTSESRVLASLFAQVVLVVRATGTPQHAVLEAVRIVGEGPRLGLVLNQANNGPGDPYGYYGEYYPAKETDGRTDGGAGTP